MTKSYSGTAYLLGALALAVADLIREATEDPADGLAASEPAALMTLAPATDGLAPAMVVPIRMRPGHDARIVRCATIGPV